MKVDSGKLLAIMFSSAIVPSVLASPLFYEVSTGYNALSGGGPGGPRNPEGIQSFNGSATSAIPLSLSPGNYDFRIVPGRVTGNLYPGYDWWLVQQNNPGAVFPQSGFNGGTTYAPSNGGPLGWYYLAHVWVGTSTSAQNGYVTQLDGLGGNAQLAINPGESAWLYVSDYYIPDNLGGSTVKVESLRTLNGQLTLLDTVAFAANRPIGYSVMQGTTVVTSGTVTATAPTTSISIFVPSSATGPATLVFNGSSFLRKTTAITLTGFDVSVGTVSCQNGDADSSGEVDAADIDAVIAAFGNTAVTNNDVDVSGEVDAADIDIVIANFGGVDN